MMKVRYVAVKCHERNEWYSARSVAHSEVGPATVYPSKENQFLPDWDLGGERAWEGIYDET
jgi:hypothetical protein